jgi:magnesium chelatase family protein
MLERWKSTGFDFNAVVPGAILRSPRFRLPAIASAPVDRAIARAGITARGYDRTLRLAWTLCDLEGANSPTVEHVGRALMLRRGNNE